MIKVIVDATQIHKPETGIGRVTQMLAHGLQQANTQDLDFQFLISPQGQSFFLNTPPKQLFTVSKLYKRLKFMLPAAHIWHSTYQNFRYVRKSSNCRHIVTIHDLNFLYEKEPLSANLHLRKLQKKINSADAIVAISQFVANDIKKHLHISGKHLEVIYNAVDELDTKPYSQPLFVDKNKPFFFSLSAIRRKKNFHVLVSMMQNFPDHNLYICGNFDDLEYKRYIESTISEYSLSNVFLTGPVTDAEKIWLYRYADAFLFPSLFEGFGLPIIEAMQFGTPTFISNMTCLPEIAAGHATIWNNFDPMYMTNTLRTALEEDPEIKNNKKLQMQHHAKQFTIEKNVSAYIKLYKKMSSELEE